MRDTSHASASLANGAALSRPTLSGTCLHQLQAGDWPSSSVAEFRDLALQAGFTTDTVWMDADRLFSLHLLQTGNANEG
jgi:hypothetical protein